jgi:hypothetical protein
MPRLRPSLSLRDAFLKNSRLDTFSIEPLQREFFEGNVLALLRGETELSGAGGGERI